jgi:hypothetical protein
LLVTIFIANWILKDGDLEEDITLRGIADRKKDCLSDEDE